MMWVKQRHWFHLTSGKEVDKKPLESTSWLTQLQHEWKRGNGNCKKMNNDQEKLTKWWVLLLLFSFSFLVSELYLIDSNAHVLILHVLHFINSSHSHTTFKSNTSEIYSSFVKKSVLLIEIKNIQKVYKNK